MRRKQLDFSGVDKVLCARLLREYMPIVEAVARLYPHVERDELRANGRIAILEGYLRRDKRSAEKTWIRKVIHWKLAELAGAGDGVEKDYLGTDPQLLNGADPEEQFWRASAISAISRLNVRRQIIVAAKIQGETYEEIAETLGISTARTAVEGKEAFQELRRILE